MLIGPNPYESLYANDFASACTSPPFLDSIGWHLGFRVSSRSVDLAQKIEGIVKGCVWKSVCWQKVKLPVGSWRERAERHSGAGTALGGSWPIKSSLAVTRRLAHRHTGLPAPLYMSELLFNQTLTGTGLVMCSPGSKMGYHHTVSRISGHILFKWPTVEIEGIVWGFLQLCGFNFKHILTWSLPYTCSVRLK